MSFLYHFKRKGMVGNTIYPLNVLKDIYPEVYQNQVSKYKGREHLLEKRIPLLDCLWNDVIHLSPINPQLILDIYHRDGLVPEIRKDEVFEVFKVPIEKIKEDETVCFQSYNFDPQNFDPTLNKFWEFKLETYKELEEVPEEQIEVWHKDKANGRVLFWYSHIMHILTKTTLDISDCEVISCK
ncbi:MAG: hypothetical protein GY909_08735 [Oligoflexia bacterium]|nr:hypothetical protein [Oligoflexia bacterium]